MPVQLDPPASETDLDPWGDVDACILEIEWYATRKINLAGIHTTGTWAEQLIEELADLRAAIKAARAKQ